MLLGKSLVPRGSELLSVSKLMSASKPMSRSSISLSVSRSSGVWCCGLVRRAALWFGRPGTGDTGGVIMVVVPVRWAPSRVFWSM